MKRKILVQQENSEVPPPPQVYLKSWSEWNVLQTECTFFIVCVGKLSPVRSVAVSFRNVRGGLLFRGTPVENH
jgi:hypothetical protein